jgi:myo-inositol-1-phosphate synthase
MMERERLQSKKISKTNAVVSQIKARGLSIEPENVHVGPSDYVPWQLDNKLCFLRIESRHFGDVPTSLECRLSVEDSPNSAGVVIDAIRCCKLALDHGISGTLFGPASYFMKSPPKQYTDTEARELTERFILAYRKKVEKPRPKPRKKAAAKKR